MRKILKTLFYAWWKICTLFPVNKNKVVIQSFNGRDFCDNPKYIALQLLKKNPRLVIYWALNDMEKSSLPQGIRPLKFKSLFYAFHMATAKVWIDNIRKPYIFKRKNQIYIQTWHGGFGLKNIEKDAANSLEAVYLQTAEKDAEMTDLMISNSHTLTKLYRDSFWYEDGEILECGLPRNDKLFGFTEQEVYDVREKLSIPRYVKIALYAPTFRKNKSLDVYDLDYKMLAKKLGERFGGEWIILLRLHPNVFVLSNNIEFDNKIIYNASLYSDIQELYMISDVVITDYSSVMFDFMILNRPCLLYASDVEEYRKDRDFFVSIDSLPFPMAQNNEELAEIILNFDETIYNQKVKKFYDFHGFCDRGHASEEVADWIIERISKIKA